MEVSQLAHAIVLCSALFLHVLFFYFPLRMLYAYVLEKEDYFSSKYTKNNTNRNERSRDNLRHHRRHRRIDICICNRRDVHAKEKHKVGYS